MKLRTKRIEEWITVEGATPDEIAKFLVHPLTPKEVSELLEKCKKSEWEKGQRFSEPDWYRFKMQKIYATIIDWEGIEDEEGVELRCINANKEAIFLANPEFMDKVLDKADALAKDIADNLEKEAKNSQTVQTGTEMTK